METISTYLDNMFLNLPRTKEVIQAKQELLQMMEDKYTELKEEGKTENEAVGIVISEFGNLDEIAESLGISAVVDGENEKGDVGELYQVEETVTKRLLSLEEAKEFVSMSYKKAWLVAIGVFLCINSVVVGPVLSEMISGARNGETTDLADGIGGSCMFVAIAIAVGLFIGAGMMMKSFGWIEKKDFVTNFETKSYVEELEKDYQYKHMIQIIFGVIFCILSVVPAMLLDALSLPGWYENLSGALLFVFVGIGVLLIVKTSIVQSSYETIIKDEAVQYEKKRGGKKEVEFANPKVQAIMDLYYPTITCIYLCWSFVTFDWHISWIIWPVAAIVRKILKVALCNVD